MLAANRQVGEYRVTRQIGQGGLGAVFAAVHRANPDLRVAIKVLHPGLTKDPQLAARFRHEAEATQLIQHPGVVKVHDFLYLEDNISCIVMEYLDGESLQQRLTRAAGPLPLAEALGIHGQVAAVLAVAHAQGIIHRDLKPGNVMLVAASGAGTLAKVLDFGIAKVATNDFTQLGTDDGKSVLGTLAFMAPEQFMTPSLVSGQADVYSLGIMLHWALAGSLPFSCAANGQGAQLFAYYTMHSEQAPPALPAHTPTGVAQLVTQMLAKSPAARPTMQQVAARLRELTSGPLLPGRGAAPFATQPTGANFARLERWQLAPLLLGYALLVGALVTVLLRTMH